MILFSILLLISSMAFYRAHLARRREERASSLLEARDRSPAGEGRAPHGLPGIARSAPLAGRRDRLLILASVAVILALTRNPFLCLLPPLALFALRRSLRSYRERRGETRKEEQIPEFIDSLTQSLRSGLSLQQSLEASLEDVGPELGAELGELVGEIRAGEGLEGSLLRAAERTASPSLRLALTALGLLHGRGGDLPRVLDRIRGRVCEALDARREVRMLTSQSRVSGYLVSSLPLAFLALQAALSPSSLRPLLSTPTGNLLALAALSLNIAAFLLIRRMTEGR